jgi:uncharacterized protein YijF (DUF1287 family)
MAERPHSNVMVTIAYDDGSRMEFDFPEGESLLRALICLDKYALSKRLYNSDGKEKRFPFEQ